MANADNIRHFDGLTSLDSGVMPAWYRSENNLPDGSEHPEIASFAETYRELINAETSEVAWKVPDPIADNHTVEDIRDALPDDCEVRPGSDAVWVTTERHNAVYSPDLFQRAFRAGVEAEDPLLNIPTDSYGLVDPFDFLRPLENALEARDTTEVYGQFREYNRGAVVHGDIWIDPEDTELPGSDGDPMKFGITVGWGHLGNTALSASIIAQDTACANSLRNIAEKKTRRHVSERDDETLTVSEYESWWADLLGKIDAVRDHLTRAIADAREVDVNPAELPFDLDELYHYLGESEINQPIPQYLATEAANEATRRSSGVPNVWDLHSGGTYALTHTYRGGEAGAVRQYYDALNNLLFDPSETLTGIEEAFYNDEADDGTEQEALPDEERGIAAIQSVRDDLEAAKDEYERRHDQVRTILQDGD